MKKGTMNMQLRALNRWEFKEAEAGTYTFSHDNLEIIWSMVSQHGACTIDGQLSLIKNWDHLDDLMQQTALY